MQSDGAGLQGVFGGTKLPTLCPGLTIDQQTECAGMYNLHSKDSVCSSGLNLGDRRSPAQKPGHGPVQQGAECEKERHRVHTVREHSGSVSRPKA